MKRPTSWVEGSCIQGFFLINIRRNYKAKSNIQVDQIEGYIPEKIRPYDNTNDQD